MKAIPCTLLLLAVVVLFVGCGPTIVNTTPNPMTANPSGIYTISMAVESVDGSVDKSTFEPRLVIDGQAREMRPSPVGDLVYEYDYVMPDGRRTAQYYFEMDYEVNQSGIPKPRNLYTDKYDLMLTNRYVITLESPRGPVGATIPVLGRGFSQYDTLVVGGLEADTVYKSSNALTFTVPPLEENRSYAVYLQGSHGRQYVADFHVDASRIRVTPNDLELPSGQRAILAFAIDFEAPAGGLPIDVTTDIPQSVIMPEVVIPQGERSVSIPVEGGRLGSGMLFIKASGFNEQRVGVRVTGTSVGFQQGPSNALPASPSSQPAIFEEEIIIIEEE